MPEDNVTKRNDLLTRWNALYSERSSWVSHWREISTYLLPRNGRFFESDANKGTRKHNSIYDNTSTRALRVLGAGLMAGATSPARPWFRLGTHDPDLNDFQPVKVWLSDVASRMHRVFQKSNTYRALHQIYEELGAFGTGASVVMPNFQNVIHHYPLTCGEYCIATDAEGKVCTLYREFQMTVSQLVKQFGYENCSTNVQQAFDGKHLDSWITVIHAIEPRYGRDPSKRDNRNMPWKSVYFEKASESDKVLSESGFRQFPALVPRWAVMGGDIYGNSPGMEALGDIKALQQEQLRKAQAIDFQSNPPILAPMSAKGQETNFLPGGTTYIDMATMGNQSVKSAFDVPLKLDHLLLDIQDVRQRIQSTFYSDLFMMIANAVDNKMTATEVALLQEEKLLMIGPVLERLDNELLYPMIDMTFERMVEGGAIPPAPQEMQGMELSVEFISMLAQAQRAVATNSVDRFVGNLGAIAQFKPEVLDKFDADEWVDSYSDQLGVDPKLIVASDKVALIRQARDKAQAAAQAAALAEQNSKTAKNLATAPTGGQQNALQDVMGMFSGYQSPTATEVQ